jgi:hypothetical protein
LDRKRRRVKAWGAANAVPVVFCKAGQRKHRIAEEYLATHEVTGPGVFLVLVAKAPATVWKVKRSANGLITNLETKSEYVSHYSFHIMDPDWGYVTIKRSGHPPFGGQVILNGHEYVACQTRHAQIAFGKDGNCFTAVADPRARPRSQMPRRTCWVRLLTTGWCWRSGRYRPRATRFPRSGIRSRRWSFTVGS